VSEIWLAYMPASTSRGFGIGFEIFFFINVGEDLACRTPYSCVRLRFGFLISLPVPVVG
jgi:hypothetical protein